MDLINKNTILNIDKLSISRQEIENQLSYTKCNIKQDYSGSIHQWKRKKIIDKINGNLHKDI